MDSLGSMSGLKYYNFLNKTDASSIALYNELTAPSQDTVSHRIQYTQIAPPTYIAKPVWAEPHTDPFRSNRIIKLNQSQLINLIANKTNQLAPADKTQPPTIALQNDNLYITNTFMMNFHSSLNKTSYYLLGAMGYKSDVEFNVSFSQTVDEDDEEVSTIGSTEAIKKKESDDEQSGENEQSAEKDELLRLALLAKDNEENHFFSIHTSAQDPSSSLAPIKFHPSLRQIVSEHLSKTKNSPNKTFIRPFIRLLPHLNAFQVIQEHRWLCKSKLYKRTPQQRPST